ncbi:MAG: hypothetical protein L6420_11105 [Elusimicrobia bacterium]|nr:hypothetical protein [Elusimicrobiota bacterium]
MNNNEKFWFDKKTKAIEDFGSSINKIKDLHLDFVKTIITIHATLLGITVALMGYIEKSPTIWLKGTWVFEIISICLGLFALKQHIDWVYEGTLSGFEFNYDMSDISEREARGEFKGGNTLREGLILAALVKRDTLSANTFSLDQIRLAKKYDKQLPSSKLFKGNAKKKWFQKIRPAFILELFFFFTSIAFVSLLISVF